MDVELSPYANTMLSCLFKELFLEAPNFPIRRDIQEGALSSPMAFPVFRLADTRGFIDKRAAEVPTVALQPAELRRERWAGLGWQAYLS